MCLLIVINYNNKTIKPFIYNGYNVNAINDNLNSLNV